MSYKATYRTRTYKLRKGGTARTSPVPSMRYEAIFREQGARLVCGVDEVGVGAWAGPVVVGAVILPPGRRIYKVRDSKLLDGPRRRWLSERVKEQALSWAIGVCWPAEIDALGLSEAIRRAATDAIGGLLVQPDAVLLDGQWNFLKRPGGDHAGQLPGFGEPELPDSFGGPVKTVVRGDCESVSIACASVVAKVFRDDLMAELASI
ncbi:MAG: ribonuclease HII, partial [Actinomycetota bacterium]